MAFAFFAKYQKPNLIQTLVSGKIPPTNEEIEVKILKKLESGKISFF